MDARRDRPHRRRRGGRDHRRPPAGAARRARVRRGLGEDAHPGPRRGRRARPGPAAARGRGAAPGPRLPHLAGRRPLHVPRLPRVPARGGGGCPRGVRPARRPGLRPRHPAPRPGPVRIVRQAAPAGEGQGPREEAARAGEGQLALHRAPPRLPRLRRRQDVRPRRRGRRRAPLPRPVLQRRLHRVGHPHPGAAREGRRGHAPRGLRPAQPRRQGADGHAGELPARRAVPHLARRAGAGRAGRDERP